MSRRLNNLLASLVAAAVGSVGIHLYLDGDERPGSQRGADEESAPRVAVKYQGIAPREPVRMTVDAGHEETVRFTLWRTTGSTSKSGDEGVPTDLAGAEVGSGDLAAAAAALGAAESDREASLTFAIEVDHADADTVTLSWKVDSAQALGTSDAAWTSALKTARKWSGESTLQRTGMPLAASMNRGAPSAPLAAELHTLVRRWMAQPAPIFPPGAIGHGAIWEVVRDGVDAGIPNTLTTRMEMTDVRGDAVEISERTTGALRGGEVSLGKQLSILNGFARRFEVLGGAGWSTDGEHIVAVGDAGASSELAVVYEMGISSLLVTSQSTMELVVQHP